ncbi:glutathione S-transferase family protein [Erythrobacter sp. SCSIO 43205]|uniref:glutathione S-transferase family protein n=1 Tax=Erythrobacter sp. SCSIO 43205 TaxID=2779361 RepID=UPI001CA9CE0D|nr:glutathione S-transferase family protein [Erythrobacter sp. SCSIO 43205]UAB77348.1 glutathione S-transferase family protein [Erythrobacter sp. SCSIO 43205]
MSESDGAAVRIFGTVTSTYTRIVQIACEEVGLSQETIATSAQSPQNRHPFGKVPVVEVDGLELIECVAITQYLDNRHGGGEQGKGALQPSDPAARAVMDKWVSVANNYLFPLFEHGLVMPWLMHRVAGVELDPEKINRALPNISRAIGFVEMELARDGAWTSAPGAAGISLADVFLYPVIRSLELTPQGEVGIAQCDHLKAWLDIMHERPSIAATRWSGEG